MANTRPPPTTRKPDQHSFLHHFFQDYKIVSFLVVDSFQVLFYLIFLVDLMLISFFLILQSVSIFTVLLSLVFSRLVVRFWYFGWEVYDT